MFLNKLKKILIIGILLLPLTSCSLFRKEPEVVIQTVTRTEYPEITIQPAPEPVELSDVIWYVVTPDNLDSFLKQFEKDNGQIVFIATTIRGYENMALNLQEIRRYILQQKEIILYYEKAVDFTEQKEAVNK